MNQFSSKFGLLSVPNEWLKSARTAFIRVLSGLGLRYPPLRTDVYCAGAKANRPLPQGEWGCI
jgi:hypothetical protein